MWFITILILCGILLIYIYVKYKRYIVKRNSNLYIEPTIELGNKILKKYNIKVEPKLIDKNHTIIKEVPKVVNKKLVIKEEKSSEKKPINKIEPSSNPKLQKILAILAGKYLITDKHILNSLKNYLEGMDLTKYETDHYLLQCCRYLFPLIHEDPLKKMLIGQYIVKKTDNNNDIHKVYDYILDIAEDIGNHIDMRMNAVDILLQSNNNKYIIPARKVLESVRKIDDIRRVNTIVDPIEDIQLQQGLINDVQLQIASKFKETIKDVPRTVFEDSQNVHNTGINESALTLARELVKRYNPAPTILQFNYGLIENFEPDQREVIEKSLHRIMTDPSTFKYETNLYIIFQSLLNYIVSLEEPLKTSVNNRLIEELQEMSGLCVTGHLTRLLNVIQGFDQVPDNLKMKISLDDEIYSTLKNKFDKILSEDEDLMDDMMTDEKRVISVALKNKCNLMLPELYSSYPIDRKNDVLQGAVKGLNKYLGKEFSIKNEVIV